MKVQSHFTGFHSNEHVNDLVCHGATVNDRGELAPEGEDNKLTRTPEEGRAIPNWVGNLLLALKLVVALVIVGLVVQNNDWSATIAALGRVSPPALAVSLSTVVLAVAVSALRWSVVVRQLGSALTPQTALVATFEGMFFNLFLPTGMGGDAVRAYRAYSEGVPTVIAIKAAMIDRALGLAMVGVLLLAGAALAPTVRQLPSFGLLTLCGAILAGGAISVAVLGKGLATLRVPLVLRGSLGLIASFAGVVMSRRFASIIAPSLLGSSLLNCLAFWMCLLAVGVDWSLFEAIVVLQASSLAAILPVSIGGWGVREGTAVVLMVALGLPLGDASAASLLYSAGLVIVGLIGAVLWLANPYRKRASLSILSLRERFGRGSSE